jgi:hypothetical protein
MCFVRGLNLGSSHLESSFIVFERFAHNNIFIIVEHKSVGPQFFQIIYNRNYFSQCCRQRNIYAVSVCNLDPHVSGILEYISRSRSSSCFVFGGNVYAPISGKVGVPLTFDGICIWCTGNTFILRIE